MRKTCRTSTQLRRHCPSTSESIKVGIYFGIIAYISVTIHRNFAGIPGGLHPFEVKVGTWLADNRRRPGDEHLVATTYR